MADEESTAPVTNVTDTSTDEAESSLEDIEVELDDIKSEDESEETEASETKAESEEDETTEDVEAEEQSEDTQKTEEVKTSDEDKQKQHNKEMAEKRIQEKQDRDKAIKDQQDQYLEGVEDPIELATRQNQVALYNLQVETNTNKLTNGYERALKDDKTGILTSDDPVIKARIDRAIDAFQAQNVVLDAYGNPTKVSGDLYKYLQEEADSIDRLTQIGKRTQEKDKGKEKSKTFTPPSRTPKEAKVDPDLDAFDEEAKKLLG